MGVFNGALSYTRYYVEGDLPDVEQREYVLERIEQYIITQLEVESEDEEAYGWACVESILDTDFNIAKLFFNEYLIFALRVERWRVPAGLLKAYVIEAERKLLLETEREYLPKQEKGELKEQLQKQLKRQTLPSLAGYDVCWHIERKELRFWSLSNRMNELFIDLFEKTFDLRLVPVTPYTIAEKSDYDEEQLEAIASLESEVFIGSGG